MKNVLGQDVGLEDAFLDRMRETIDAPADAVVYAKDPRTDLDQLEHPLAVVLRGIRVR